MTKTWHERVDTKAGKSEQYHLMTTTIAQPEEYDLLVLGSGAAGKLISWTLAKKGMKTAVIERKYVGGSCPTLPACPAKISFTALKSLPIFSEARNSGSPRSRCWRNFLIPHCVTPFLLIQLYRKVSFRFLQMCRPRQIEKQRTINQWNIMQTNEMKGEIA